VTFVHDATLLNV